MGLPMKKGEGKNEIYYIWSQCKSLMSKPEPNQIHNLRCKLSTENRLLSNYEGQRWLACGLGAGRWMFFLDWLLIYV